MIKNYFLVALRNLRKYRLFSFINIFGLALAMSVCLLVILMLSDQARYDAFHTKKDRIYRITTSPKNSKSPYATSSFPVGAYLKANYPIVEDAVTLLPSVVGDVQHGQRVFEMRGYFASPSFFQVFDFNLQEGDETLALKEPRSIIISKQLSQQLFPNENALSKTVSFSDRKLAFPIKSEGVGELPVSWGEFTITGIMEITNEKSHLTFDVLMSQSTLPSLYPEKKIDDLSNNWDWFFRPYNYVVLREGASKQELETALAETLKQHDANLQAEHAKGIEMNAQSLGDIQLENTGNDTSIRLPIQGYYLLGVLAFIIMMSACLNYANLSIARALTRTKEIGVRKVTGARRRALISQFLGESIVVSLFALTMAMLFVQLLKPAFMSLWVNQYLNFELPFDVRSYALFVGFALVTGIVAGIFPAVRMSGYQPITALKGEDNSRGSKGRLRTVLSVTQFSVSLLFITTAILIFNQFQHYMSFDYGMKTENMVNIDLQGRDYRVVANEMSSVPGVVSVSGSDLVPATGRSNSTQVKKPGNTEFTQAYVIHGDENLVSNLGLDLIAGSGVKPSNDTIETEVIVNQKFIQAMGYESAAQAIGETLESKWEKQPLTIVGVVKDFRFQLLINRHEPDPLIIFNRPSNIQYLNVRVSTTDYKALTAAIEAKWKLIDPIHAPKYEFYDDELAGTHQAISDIVSILGFISFLAIVIACLGLLGMATYMAERRKKEVGVRKVLGAANWGITVLLSRAFLKILGISILIGAPLSFFVNDLWLQYLPNRTEFGVGTVLIACSMLLLLGLITIGSQTIAASKRKVVDVLKEL